jgi:hypothetical protein
VKEHLMSIALERKEKKLFVPLPSLSYGQAPTPADFGSFSSGGPYAIGVAASTAVMLTATSVAANTAFTQMATYVNINIIHPPTVVGTHKVEEAEQYDSDLVEALRHLASAAPEATFEDPDALMAWLES